MSTLGERIRAARKRRNLSQAKVAQAIGGLTREAVSQWESDDSRPSTANLLKLKEILNISLSELIGEDDEGVTRVPLLSWVSAGRLAEGETIDDTGDVPLIGAADLPPGDWVALRVEGTSMDRLAPPDAVILVNRAERALVPNGCYVFRTEQGTAFKRYRRDPERFEPFSTDPRHEAIFPQGRVSVLGRVRRVLIEL